MNYFDNPSSFFIWTGDLVQILVATGLIILIVSIFTKVFLGKSLPTVTATTVLNRVIPLRKRRKEAQDEHRWIEAFDMSLGHPLHCNVCESIVDSGNLCLVCSAATHHECFDKLFLIECKRDSLWREDKMKHKWIKGNLPLLSKCSVCKEACGDEPTLCDFRCVWCRKTVHSDCQTRIDQNCDLGKYKQFVIPPLALKKLSRWKNPNFFRQKTTIIPNNLPKNLENWTPMLVFINPKSGGNEGIELMRLFYSVLNPVQVVNLTQISPDLVLQQFVTLPNLRIVVCGGDGSVGWILNSLQKTLPKNSQSVPPVAIIPLGTGNDLSRILGCGAAYKGEGINDILNEIMKCNVVEVDRWGVDLRIQSYLAHLGRKESHFIMNNYFSIGVDAHVANNFHETRKERPDLFKNRHLNKAWYGLFGAKEYLVEGTYKDFQDSVEIIVDGKKIDLTNLEAVVVQNINSYGGGMKLWHSEEHPSLLGDKKFEVLGILSSFHVGRIQMGISDAVQICQGSTIQIKTTRNLAMQVDGEPWIQPPSVLKIMHHSQVKLMTGLNVDHQEDSENEEEEEEGNQKEEQD